MATEMGHIKQEKQNLQSTNNFEDDFHPSQPSPNDKTSEFFAQLVQFSPRHKVFGDLTGKFPYISSRGYQYFIVVYEYDSNAILVELRNKRGIHDNHQQDFSKWEQADYFHHRQ